MKAGDYEAACHVLATLQQKTQADVLLGVLVRRLPETRRAGASQPCDGIETMHVK